MALKGHTQKGNAFSRRCDTPSPLRFRIRKDKYDWHIIEANATWDTPWRADIWKAIAQFRDRDEGLEYLAVKLGRPDLFVDKPRKGR